jgi:hypothetical protein
MALFLCKLAVDGSSESALFDGYRCAFDGPFAT